MNVFHTFLARATWLLPVAASLVLVAACGGDDDDGGSTTPATAVVCDLLGQASYTYTASTITSVEAAPGPIPTGVIGGPAPLQLTQTADGQVEDGVNVAAHLKVDDGGVLTTEYEIRDINGLNYADYGGGWQEVTQRANLIPYRPWFTCAAIQQDIDLTAASTGVREKVGDTNTMRYDVTLEGVSFAARHPDLGAGSDVAAYVESFSGTIWVADDGYIAKLDVSGAGEYPDGKPIKIHLTYEVSELGGDINVEVPI